MRKIYLREWARLLSRQPSSFTNLDDALQALVDAIRVGDIEAEAVAQDLPSQPPHSFTDDEYLLSMVAITPAGIEAWLTRSGYEVPEHVRALNDAPIKSGMAGRPTSRALLQQEFELRLRRGDKFPSLAAAARELVAWLKRVHPLHTATQRTVEGHLLDLWRRRDELASTQK